MAHARTARTGKAGAIDKEPASTETQMKALFQRLVTVQEDERRRISRDLHDHLGQQLTALRMNLEVFRLQCDLDPARLRQLERTQRLAEELDRSIDFLTWQLRPAAFEHLGLGAALTELVSAWSERFALEAQFQTIGTEPDPLARDIEENLYRIAQEALNNIVKHARATRVSMLLEHRDDVITLAIEDDGCGFEPSPEVRMRDGMPRLGLVGMRERAALLGGDLLVETAPGSGTALIVRVPFK